MLKLLLFKSMFTFFCWSAISIASSCRRAIANLSRNTSLRRSISVCHCLSILLISLLFYLLRSGRAGIWRLYRRRRVGCSFWPRHLSSGCGGSRAGSRALNWIGPRWLLGLRSTAHIWSFWAVQFTSSRIWAESLTWLHIDWFCTCQIYIQIGERWWPSGTPPVPVRCLSLPT